MSILRNRDLNAQRGQQEQLNLKAVFTPARFKSEDDLKAFSTPAKQKDYEEDGLKAFATPAKYKESNDGDRETTTLMPANQKAKEEDYPPIESCSCNHTDHGHEDDLTLDESNIVFETIHKDVYHPEDWHAHFGGPNSEYSSWTEFLMKNDLI